MINSKAIKVLKTFNAEELKQFGRFVNSPYHNNNKNLSRLFLYLKKDYPEFNSSKENIYKYLYPRKKYSYDVLRHHFAGLYRLCEDFLAHSALNSDPFTRKSYVLNKFNEKKLDSLFIFNFKKLEDSFGDSKIGYEHFRDRAELENNMIKFLLLRDKQHKITNNVLKRGEYFMSSLFRWVELQVSDINVQRHNYSKLNIPNAFEAFLAKIDLRGFSDWLENNMCDRFVYLAMYSNLLLIWKYPEDESIFYRTKKVVLNNFKLIEDKEKQNLINSLINYCNYNLKYFRNEKFIKEEFELNKISLTLFDKSKFILRNIEYNNIVDRALELKEIQWAEYFIENYTKYAADDINIRNFALAKLCLEKGNYEESLGYLNKFKPVEPFFKLQSRLLILKLLYELNLSEQAFSCIESLRHFTANSKEIGDSYKKSINIKIKIFNMLFDLKMNIEQINEFTLMQLKKILNETGITGRRWYMEKIKELELCLERKTPSHSKVNLKQI